jgi:hypothetical protein
MKEMRGYQRLGMMNLVGIWLEMFFDGEKVDCTILGDDWLLGIHSPEKGNPGPNVTMASQDSSQHSQIYGWILKVLPCTFDGYASHIRRVNARDHSLPRCREAH